MADANGWWNSFVYSSGKLAQAPGAMVQWCNASPQNILKDIRENLPQP
jgi:hypothetical protein